MIILEHFRVDYILPILLKHFNQGLMSVLIWVHL